MNAPETGEDRETSLRREKRQFMGACICAAMFLLVFAAVIIYVEWNAKEVGRVTAFGASAVEIGRLKVKAVAVMNLGSFGSFVCVLGFGLFFARWLPAIRRRRKEGAGLPPSV